MPKKSFSDFVREGLSFASQTRFLAIQAGFYALAGLVSLLSVAAVAVRFVEKISSGNLQDAIAALGGTIVLLLAVVFLLVVGFWLASLWLALFFINAAKRFVLKKESRWREESTAAASRRFLPFLAASIVMSIVGGVGAVFFLLLDAVAGLSSLSSLLSTLYALFFSLSFLYAPFFLATQDRGVWDALSKSFGEFKKNPARTLLLLLAVQIAGIAALVVALIPAGMLAVLAISILAGGMGFASVAASVLLFGLAGVVLLAGIAFGNLAAIGMVGSAFFHEHAATAKK